MKMNQSWAVGFSILELSKLHMYTSFYETILPTFGEENVELLMHDTDSLALQIYSTGSTTTALSMLAPIMDYSNLHSEHPLYDGHRKNQLGYFKSEVAGTAIKFAGVKPKRSVNESI